MKLEAYFLKKAKLIFGNDYFKDGIIRVCLTLSSALDAALWFYIGSLVKQSRYSIALHYTVYFGIDLLGESKQVLVIALVGLIVLITNVVLGYRIYNYSKLGSHFLAVSSILIQIFLFLAAYGLVLING